MNYFYGGVKIDYVSKFSKNETVNVFLHGWGRSKEDFYEIIEALRLKNYLILDFPPFGKSGQPSNWTIFTYASMVTCLLNHLKIKKVNLIGHSFGGRVAIIISGKEKELVNKLVLVDSAGLKPKSSRKKKFLQFKFKLYKKLNLNTKNFGSKDYKNLSDNMKKIFVSVVNTYLDENAKLIEAKTLIIYGKNDIETPVYMAKRFNNLISNSKLIFIENAGHFCFFERKIKFCEILNEFLGGE